MNGRTASWQDIRQRAAATMTSPPPREDIATLSARLFETADGQAWLTAMRAEKFLAPQDADMTESRLRHLEGQRQLLRDIDRLVAEGMARREAKTRKS